MTGFSRLRRYLPILEWGRRYDRSALSNDLVAALIVTIMLIPQSLAYAMLAGLPPEAGIYASIVPILLYSVFGTSRALAVGPVAVISLLTASAIGNVADEGTAGYAVAALTLAFLSGGMLLLLGLLRLGFLANFLSHPVIAGFITASGLLIAASQMRHLFGIDAHGHTLPEIAGSLLAHLGETSWITLLIGAAATAFLFWARKGLKAWLDGTGLPPLAADIIARAGPVAAVVVSTLAVWAFGLNEAGVRIVGAVPQSLPPLTLPSASLDLIRVPRDAGPPDLDHRVRRIDLGRADTCREKAPAHRPGSGTDRPWRREYRRGLDRGLSGHRRVRAVGGEL